MKYLWMLSLALIANSVLSETQSAEKGVVPGDSLQVVAGDDRDSGVPAEAKGRPIQIRPIRCYRWSQDVAIELRTSTEGLSDDLKAVWKNQIDFTKESMIRVAAGQRNSTGYGIRITGVELIDNCYHVTIDMSGPKPGRMVGHAITFPTAAVVIPKAAAGASVKFVNGPKSRVVYSQINPAINRYKVWAQGSNEKSTKDAE